MTKRDHRILAEALRKARQQAVYHHGAPGLTGADIAVVHVADALKADNSSFDKDLFYAAVRDEI